MRDMRSAEREKDKKKKKTRIRRTFVSAFICAVLKDAFRKSHKKKFAFMRSTTVSLTSSDFHARILSHKTQARTPTNHCFFPLGLDDKRRVVIYASAAKVLHAGLHWTLLVLVLNHS
jgi:hypothetical protein